MRRLAVAVSLASALAFAPLRAFQQPSAPVDPQFRAGVNLVSIYATVVDNNGRIVPDLTLKDFVVYDDGKPQVITEFANTVQPITVVVMLDRSVSLAPKFERERAAAEAFVDDMTPGDKARIGSFNSMIRIDPGVFTGDRDELIRILHFDLLDAGLTPLWNATSSAMNALAGQKGRRVVLLLSDGHNNTGLPGRHTVTFEEVRDRAVADDIVIYAVGITNPCGPAPQQAGGRDAAPRFQQRGGGPPAPPGGGPDGGTHPGPPARPIFGPTGPTSEPGPGLSMPWDRLFGNHMGEGKCTGAEPSSDLADLVWEGGGGYINLHDNDDLAATFARLADELHHQYLLGITVGKLDGHTHNLQVQTRDPNLHVRARTNYLAAKK